MFLCSHALASSFAIPFLDSSQALSIMIITHFETSCLHTQCLYILHSPQLLPVSPHKPYFQTDCLWLQSLMRLLGLSTVGRYCEVCTSLLPVWMSVCSAHFNPNLSLLLPKIFCLWCKFFHCSFWVNHILAHRCLVMNYTVPSSINGGTFCPKDLRYKN